MSSEETNVLPIVTIVLAGGMSRRMGRDKARLVIHQLPMLTQICQIADALSDAVYVVHGSDRSYADLLPDRCRIVLDRTLEGPLVALQIALGQALVDHPNVQWFLVLACDLPSVTTVTLQAWRQTLTTLPIGTQAYLPKNPEKGWEPLCGFYHRQVFASLTQSVHQGERSMQRWLHQTTIAPWIIVLVEANADTFVNCNTLSDYHRLLLDNQG